MYRNSANGHPEAYISEPPPMSLAGPADARRFARRTRRLDCDEAALKEIGRVAGRTVSREEVRTALGQAAQDASALALAAAEKLRRSRRSEETKALFRTAFGTRLGYVPSWRPAGKRWDRGGVVRTRFQRTAKILDGGFIRYFCWGPHAVPKARWKESSSILTLSGVYRLAFGEGFWRNWREQDREKMASTFLLGALRIYFGPRLSYAAGPPGFGNINCYAAFALRAAGQPVPEKLAKRCAAAGTAVSVKPPPAPTAVPKTGNLSQPQGKPAAVRGKKKTAVVRIILIDPAGIFKRQKKLRKQFAATLQKKFNDLDRAWLKKEGFRFRVSYRSGMPTTVQQAKFGPLDFPVYLLGRQHGVRTVMGIMKRHKIPKKIGKTRIYKLAKECWTNRTPRGCGIPSGRKGYRKVAFIKTQSVFAGAMGPFAQAFTNITAHEIGHMGNLSHGKKKKGLMKASVHLDKPLDFSMIDNSQFRGNLLRLQTLIRP